MAVSQYTPTNAQDHPGMTINQHGERGLIARSDEAAQVMRIALFAAWCCPAEEITDGSVEGFGSHGNIETSGARLSAVFSNFFAKAAVRRRPGRRTRVTDQYKPSNQAGDG